MNSPCNLRKIERLGWNITASVNLQFEFLNIAIIFVFLGHFREEFHSHRTDVQSRALTLLAGSPIHSSEWRLRAAGLKHHAPEIWNQYYSPWMLTFLATWNQCRFLIHCSEKCQKYFFLGRVLMFVRSDWRSVSRREATSSMCARGSQGECEECTLGCVVEHTFWKEHRAPMILLCSSYVGIKRHQSFSILPNPHPAPGEKGLNWHPLWSQK